MAVIKKCLRLSLRLKMLVELEVPSKIVKPIFLSRLYSVLLDHPFFCAVKPASTVLLWLPSVQLDFGPLPSPPHLTARASPIRYQWFHFTNAGLEAESVLGGPAMYQIQWAGRAVNGMGEDRLLGSWA